MIGRPGSTARHLLGLLLVRLSAFAAFAAFAALAALGLTTAGCAKGTYLEVHFTGPSDLPAVRLDIALTLMPSNSTPVLVARAVEPDAAKGEPAVKLPTSLAFKLDDHTGQLLVEAMALDASGHSFIPPLQTAKTTTIMSDQTWTLEMNFQ